MITEDREKCSKQKSKKLGKHDIKLQRVANEINQKSYNHFVDFDLSSKFHFGNFNAIRNKIVIKVRHF